VLRRVGDERLDAVARQEELVALVRLGRMHGDLGWRQPENQPSAPDIDVRQAEDVS
jgi:hypothetical protein